MIEVSKTRTFLFFDIKDRKTGTFTMTFIYLDTKENAANYSKNFRRVLACTNLYFVLECSHRPIIYLIYTCNLILF